VSLVRQRGIVTVRCTAHAIRYPCLHLSTNSGTG
jgi:hypothetical protein